MIYLLASVPPVPGRDRIGILPEPHLAGLGRSFSRLVISSLLRRLLLLVLPVPPGHAGLHLSQIGVAAIDHHHADLSPVPVDLAAIEGDFTAKYEVGQMLLGCLTECLLGFRRVNAGEANLVAGLGAVKDRDRISVADADNPTVNGVG